jgi:hypothetical protein
MHESDSNQSDGDPSIALLRVPCFPANGDVVPVLSRTRLTRVRFDSGTQKMGNNDFADPPCRAAKSPSFTMITNH